jgi:hypothetical protein
VLVGSSGMATTSPLSQSSTSTEAAPAGILGGWGSTQVCEDTGEHGRQLGALAGP